MDVGFVCCFDGVNVEDRGCCSSHQGLTAMLRRVQGTTAAPDRL